MKKFLFSMICALFPILASAQEPYAVLSDDNTTLTFLYDDQKATSGGMDIGPFDEASDRGWNEHCESINQVVFAEAFAGCTTITSTSYWFDGFTNLTEIDGLENLNTNNVTDMSCMFNGCEKLESLNLSGFITSNVTYMSLMFGGCSSLEELDLSTFNTSNVQSMDGMFRGCSGLTSLDVSSFNTDNVTEMSEMFAGCSNLTNLDFGDSNTSNVSTMFNTSNVTTMWAMFSGCSSLGNLDLSNFNTANVENMSAMFSGCSSLTNLDISNFNTENVISMANMFDGCSNLESLQMDSNNFSTESVTNMGSMFGGCLKLTTLDLSGFKTSNVSDFSHMFASCSGLTSLDVTGFDTSNAENMTSMFSGCSSLTYLNLSHFNTSNVTAMSSMFESCSKLDSLNLSTFDTSNATDLSYMFYGCSRLKNLDLSSFNTSTVEEMQFMFYQCNGLETILVGNGWNTGNINAGANMFTGCTPLVGGAGTTYDGNHLDYTYAHIDSATNPGYLSGPDQAAPYAVLNVLNEVNGLKLTFYYDNQKAKRGGMSVGPFTLNYDDQEVGHVNSGWDEQRLNIVKVEFDESFADCTSITSTSYWFYGFINLTEIKDLEYLNTNNVTEMVSMFSLCSHLTSLDVSHFNTSKVTTMNSMFNGCSMTSLDLSGFDTSNATDLSRMFVMCTNLTTLNVSGFNTSNATDLSAMFEGCSGLTSLDVTEFDTSNATDLSAMFLGCLNLTELDVSHFNTSKATNLSGMFENCESLTTLDVSHFNTSNVTTMKEMFGRCKNLTTLDVSGFDTSNTTDLSYMFWGCSGLTSLDVSNFNTANVAYMHLMFNQCSELETIYVGNGWSTENITSEDAGAAMFTDCTALVGGAGTTYDANNVDYHYAHIDKATSDPSDPGYFTGKVPYAVLSEDNTVLTFYCGAQATDDGMSVGPFTESSQRGWNEQSGNIEKVVFDGSFANCTTITSTRYWFAGFTNLTTFIGLDIFKTNNVTDMSGMFWGCSKMESLNLNNFITSKTTDMSYMFWDCSGLISLDVTEFDTSNATDMSNMFGGCSKLESLDLSNFNTSNVTTMWGMFSGCSKLTDLDVREFNTSKTKYMGEMFNGCSSLVSLDLSHFNTENVTTMNSMFGDCSSLTSLDLSHFNTEDVTTMSSMFSGCESLTNLDLTSFNTLNVPYMNSMFSQCSGLETIYVGNGWSTESITSVDAGAAMFTDCTALVGGAGTTYDENIVDFTYAHIDGGTSNPGYLTGQIPYAVLSEVNNKLTLTFYYDDQKAERDGMTVGPFTWKSERGWAEQSEEIEQVIFNESFANCTTITSTSYWFCGFTKLTTIIDMDKLNTDNVTEMLNMFDGCSSLISLDVSHFNTSNTTDMNDMFKGCSSLTSLDVSNFNTSKVTNMFGMFKGCSGLTSLYVTGFDTSNVTDMSNMFDGCSSLASLDVTGFDTSNVTDMEEMFRYCSSLENLDVSNFNTSKVSEMHRMFYQCSGLETISVGKGWSTESITSEEHGINMFTECIALRGGAGTEYDPYHVDYTYAHIDGGEMNPGYLTGPSYEPYAVLSDNNTVLIFYYDDQKDEREGMSVGPFTTDTREWKDYVTEITYVEFDPSFDDCTSITSTARWFDGCSNLTKISGIKYLHTENVTSMRRMFNGCSGLEKLDVSGFNTESVTDMGSMFNGCSGLKALNVTGFNTESVTDMSSMFNSCSGLTILDLSNFITINAENMRNLFRGCSSLKTIYVGYEWITEPTMEGNNMFLNCTNIEGGAGTQYDGDHTNQAYAHVDGGTSDPGYLTGPNQPRPYAVLSEDNNGLTLTFYYDNKKDERGGMDVGPFDDGGKKNGCGWSEVNEEITTVVFDDSFANCTTLTSTAYWFYGCENLTTIKNFSNLKTDNVIDINSMFHDCHSLKSIDFSSLNLSKVTNMHQVFEDCRTLESVNFSGVNTENVTDMSDLFLNCHNLKTIDISSFNTKNVTKMTSMFLRCDVLTTIYVGEGWTTENVTKSESMFRESPNLVGGRGTTYDANHVDIEYAHIDGGASDPGYLTDINGSGGASDETWAELKATIDYGTDVLARAKESSTVEAWMIEDLEMMLESGNQMYNIHEADEEEVRHMIEELNHIIHEVEEAMNVPASDEAWAELHEAVEAGEKLQIEAKDVSTVEPWALEELENMTAKGSEMYKVHTADEEEVRHMTEELRHIINEVEDMMRKQPEPQDEALFDGLTAYVNGKATLDNAFESVGGRTEAAKTIAAIVWNGDSALTANMLAGIDNPNLLVYVTEASKAPSGVQNVVINGIAEKIVLTDATGNNNFYCPQSFTAQSISYTRDFSQTTEIQVSRGWETIALPFPVQNITHETHGALAPFGSGSNAYPFWLRQLTSNGLTRATMIEANKPYLISMPNNSFYPAEYNQNGKVTFSSTRVTVPVTSAQSNSYNGITLYAAFQQVTKSSSIYALNVGEARGEYPEGSVFEQNYRDIRPFQAYTTHTNNINRYITVGSLGNADDNATGIEELRFKNFEDAEGTWYSLDGRRLDAKPTKKGIYVKDGRKIVIK